MSESEIWSDGLVCAFEYIKVAGSDETCPSYDQEDTDYGCMDKLTRSHWIPIGWERISELTQRIQADGGRTTECMDSEDVAAWPTWWCHVAAGHEFTASWLQDAQWLHPDVSKALRDESSLINDDEHLHYEVPVRVEGGGLLFKLLGQTVLDSYVDTPLHLRCFTAQNFLISVVQGQGTTSLMGITDVQELLLANGYSDRAPRTIHGVIAQLASSLSCRADGLFQSKSTLGCKMIDWKLMRRRKQHDEEEEEDMNAFSENLHQEIRELSGMVLRDIKSLYARKEIISELLLQHLKGTAARSLLESVRRDTEKTIERQDTVFWRLSTIQNDMRKSDRLWVQKRRLRAAQKLTEDMQKSVRVATIQDGAQKSVRSRLREWKFRFGEKYLTISGVCVFFLSMFAGMFVVNAAGMPLDKTCDLFSVLFGLVSIICFAVAILL